MARNDNVDLGDDELGELEEIEADEPAAPLPQRVARGRYVYKLEDVYPEDNKLNYPTVRRADRGRYGIEWAPNHKELRNPKTGKLVTASGKVAAKVLKDSGMLLVGTVGRNVMRAFEPKTLETNGVLRVQDYKTPRGKASPTTIGQLASSIAPLLAKHGAKARGALVYFAKEGSDPFDKSKNNRELRTVRGTAAEIAAAIDKIQRFSGTDILGSDAIGDAFTLDTSAFSIRWIEPPAGGDGRKTYKARELDYMLVKDYKCDDDDCLIGVLRNNSDAQKGKQAATIRRKLAIPAGPIALEHVDALAELYALHVEVYDPTPVARIIKITDGPTNMTTAAVEFPLLKDAGNAEHPTVQIALETTPTGGHYSHIGAFKEAKTCPVSGDIIKKGETWTDKQAELSILRQGRVWLGAKAKKNKKRKYVQKILVYDFETVWDPDSRNKLRPYSVAWYVFDPKHGPDFAGEADKVKVSYGGNVLGQCQYDLIDAIRACPAAESYTLVSYNGSRFDHLFLAEAAVSRGCLSEIFWASGCLRDVRIGRHNTLDVCRLNPGQSLKEACKGFATSPKKIDGFSHLIPQQAFLDGGAEGLYAWIAANLKKATDYVVADVLSTSSLTIKLSGAVDKLTTINPLESKIGTAAGVAWKALTKRTVVPKAAKTERVDSFYRAAITGGRTQNFKAAGFQAQGAFRMVDAKSLYPTVMSAKNEHLFAPRLQYGRYPTSEETPTDVYVEGKLGVYDVIIRSQPEKNIIPLRSADADVPLNWVEKGEIRTKITSAEIELIRHNGGVVDVLNGYFFEEDSSTLFNSFLTPLFEEKDRQDAIKDTPAANPALRAVTKILMNSCSGKLAQRNFDDMVVLAHGATQQLAAEAKMRNGQADEWISLGGSTCILVGKKRTEDVFKGEHAKPSQLSMFIYAHARCYMYELIIKRYDIMYMDTDSALLSLADYTQFRADQPELDKKKAGLGDFEEELVSKKKDDDPSFIFADANNTRVVLGGPKMYLVQPLSAEGIPASNSKAKIKGINLYADKLAIGATEFPREDARELHKLYQGVAGKTVSLKADPYLLFKQLVTTGKVSVLCSQLTKDINDFGIRQRYLVKELSLNITPVPVIEEPRSDPAELDELLNDILED